MKLQVRVKFRVFGITLGIFDKTVPLPLAAPGQSVDKVLIDERGIYVRVFS